MGLTGWTGHRYGRGSEHQGENPLSPTGPLGGVKPSPSPRNSHTIHVYNWYIGFTYMDGTRFFMVKGKQISHMDGNGASKYAHFPQKWFIISSFREVKCPNN